MARAYTIVFANAKGPELMDRAQAETIGKAQENWKRLAKAP